MELSLWLLSWREFHGKMPPTHSLPRVPPVSTGSGGPSSGQREVFFSPLLLPAPHLTSRWLLPPLPGQFSTHTRISLSFYYPEQSTSHIWLFENFPEVPLFSPSGLSGTSFNKYGTLHFILLSSPLVMRFSQFLHYVIIPILKSLKVSEGHVPKVTLPTHCTAWIQAHIYLVPQILPLLTLTP